jgi:hypothetical protein
MIKLRGYVQQSYPATNSSCLIKMSESLARQSLAINERNVMLGSVLAET